MILNSFTTKSAVFVFSIVLAACGEGVPEQSAQAAHLPPPGFIGDASTGKELYMQYCKDCHGVNGVGSDKGPAFYLEIYGPRHHANLAFHWAVSRGVRQHHTNFGDMPPIPDLTPEEVEHIILFVRALQQVAGVE